MPAGQNLKASDAMDTWRFIWREGFAPAISTEGLIALKSGLETDAHDLTQGSTTTPPPLMCVMEWPVEGCCALGYCGWKGENLTTVGEVEEYFAKLCFEADQRLGEPAGCRGFLNWFDDVGRDEMRLDLLAEVELALAGRDAKPKAKPARRRSVRKNSEAA